MNLNEVSCINLSSFCAYFTKFAIFCHLAPGDANLSALLHRVSNFGTFAPVQFPEQTKMQLLQISKIFTISTISIILSAVLAHFIILPRRLCLAQQLPTSVKIEQRDLDICAACISSEFKAKNGHKKVLLWASFVKRIFK